MARRDKRQVKRHSIRQISTGIQSTSAPGRPVTGWKLWRFRLLLALGVPVAILGLLEFGLRVSGLGYVTNFLLPADNQGTKTFVQNNAFGWRFFGREMARTPAPFSISQVKRPDTIRIFVLGESAAMGDPQPKFGLPRFLQAMLELRYPTQRFEVVNGAMTAINSNVILPIASDCSAAGGDIWVIYMGNNEVVGPFGAGTVFGTPSLPLPLIHANVALKSTRTGQFMENLGQRFKRRNSEAVDWGGMEMFLNHQVPIDSPQMDVVRDHFRRNIAEILQTAQRSGTKVVLSTVAVNLKNCAPFASRHRAILSEPDKATWQQNYEKGIEAQKSGKNAEAEKWFRAAAQIDDQFAELRFRQASCDLARGDESSARKNFAAARDLDTLRFRCDSRLNELIRQAAEHREGEGILLADGERALQSPDALPDDELFYDHVHLTFEGNYLLARTIAGQIEKLLPGKVASHTRPNQPWPSQSDCARRLGWCDWDRQAALSEVLARMTIPPFSDQFNHNSQLQRMRESLEKLGPAQATNLLREAVEGCEKALAMAPDDPLLLEQLASLKRLTGDLAAAAKAAQRGLELLPGSTEGLSTLGVILVQQERYNEAIDCFKRAFDLDTQNVRALQNLAQTLARLHRSEEAIHEYRHALEIKPRFGPAWLGLGQILEQAGKKGEADNCYQKALANPVHGTMELTTLAHFCQSRGWLAAAATNYSELIKLNPCDAMLEVEAGQCFAALDRHAEAESCYAEATRLAPGFAPAHFLYGMELGKSGRDGAAAGQFQQALDIMPDFLEARLNLAFALMNETKLQDSLTQFENVLQQSPTNALALKYAQALRAKLSAGPGE